MVNTVPNTRQVHLYTHPRQTQFYINTEHWELLMSPTHMLFKSYRSIDYQQTWELFHNRAHEYERQVCRHEEI